MNKKNKNTRILEAAFTLFSESGYKNTKIADIAAKAGIGKGTIYEYYDSKEDIFIVSVLEKVMEDYARITKEIASYPSTLEKLKFFLDFELSVFAKYGADASELKAHLVESDSYLSEKMRDALSAVLTAEHAIISDIIKSGIATGEIRNVDVNLLANFIISFIASFFLFEYNLLPCSYPADVSNRIESKVHPSDALLDLLFNGIAGK